VLILHPGSTCTGGAPRAALGAVPNPPADRAPSVGVTGHNVGPTLKADAAKVTVPPPYSDRAAATAGTRGSRGVVRGFTASGPEATCSGAWEQLSVTNSVSQLVRGSGLNIIGLYCSIHWLERVVRRSYSPPPPWLTVRACMR
jgi:hypothetical protein